MIEIIYFIFSALLGISLIITISNWKFLKSLSDLSPIALNKDNRPLVSILVPARNEENGITDCIEGLASQTYDPMEVLILNDRSTDSTAVKIKTIVDHDDRMRMIEGKDVPTGWVGKNWACYQLFQQSTGELLIFMDADTVLSPETVSVSISELKESEADLLTVMPGRRANTVVEKLMFAFMDWILFCWMPIKTSENRGSRYLSTAFGQFMLFRRQSYQEIGGHYAIKGEPLDDFNLGRTARRMGLRRLIFQASDWVSVLPYEGSVDAFKGVSRSVFPAVNYSVSAFLGLATMLCIIGLVPMSTIILTTVVSSELDMSIGLSAASLVMVSITWLLACMRFSHSLILVIFHPISILLMLLVAGYSLATYVFRKTDWKDRRIVGQKIRF